MSVEPRPAGYVATAPPQRPGVRFQEEMKEDKISEEGKACVHAVAVIVFAMLKAHKTGFSFVRRDDQYSLLASFDVPEAIPADMHPHMMYGLKCMFMMNAGLSSRQTGWLDLTLTDGRQVRLQGRLDYVTGQETFDVTIEEPNKASDATSEPAPNAASSSHQG